MLTLHLTLTNHQVSVRANGKDSHQFSLLELSQSEQEWKDFYRNPRVYGGKLFNALFRDAARAEFDALSKQTERTIVLVLESPELDGVAWEYAYNKAKEEYVVEDCAFVRALPEKERPANGRLISEVDRVPLLFIPANPLVDLSGEPMRTLDVEGEWREMKRHIEKSNAPFDMIELRPATPEALQSVMARFQNGMIAHFSGHGVATKDGAILLFERENGASNPLEAREFVREIKDKAWIGFLSACQSAVPERTEFSNLARELAKAGVPFALGMQFNLPDPFAPNISGQFYNYLAHGHAVPEAARQARRAVKRENEFHEIMVGMIALYAAHPDEAGKLIWHGLGAQTVNLFRPADVSDLPSPASGLIGRQHELMRIGTRLLEGKKPLTVTLHGAGGIGKTALLWQALLRFAPSFELTLAIGLDPLPSLESVLGRIERFLGLPSPCSNDTKERETIVRNALTSKRTLLGLDNFETLNHALNDDATKRTAKSLYAFFKSLPAEGVTLCVTSREKTSLPGEHIEEIYGLEDAMGGALFYENVSTRKDALNEAGLEKLSAAVGGHPLALRLLAPIFEEQAGLSLEQFTEKLQTFLPKASDQWSEQERHESLGACFAFSMDNLPKSEEGEKLRVAISRLSVFIAFFVDFTSAPVLENHFPDSEKGEKLSDMLPMANKRLHALWERGLLERATISLSEENFYLYRLHPALGYFAKGHLTDEETVKENYLKSMSNLAHIAEVEIVKNSLIVQVVLRAVPDLLYSAGSKSDHDAALMQFRVSKLLGQFGLYDDALKLLDRSTEIFEYSGDLEGKYASQLEEAKIQEARGNIDLAMRLYQQVLKMAEGLGNLQIKPTALCYMAEIYITRGNLDKAEQLYQQAIEIFEKLDDLQGKAIAIGSIAQIFFMRGDLERSLDLQKEKITILLNFGNIKEVGIALHNAARILYLQGDLEGAMQLELQAMQIAKDLSDRKSVSAILKGIAGICVTRGDTDKAIELYQQTLRIDEDLNDLRGKSISLNELAGIHISHANLNEAINLYDQTMQIDKYLGDLESESVTLNNLAHVYVLRGEFDSAVRLFNQALENFDRLNHPKGKSTTRNNLAQVYFLQGELEKATHEYTQALELFENMHDLQGKATALNNMGAVLFKNKQYPMALRCLVEALYIFEKMGALPNVKNTKENILEYRRLLGGEKFDALWQEETKQPIPEWLNQVAPTESWAQFIVSAIFFAYENHPEAEQYFNASQKMAADSSAPREIQELGRILQRVMLGYKNVDLSSLPRDVAELIERELTLRGRA